MADPNDTKEKSIVIHKGGITMKVNAREAERLMRYGFEKGEAPALKVEGDKTKAEKAAEAKAEAKADKKSGG